MSVVRNDFFGDRPEEPLAERDGALTSMRSEP